MEVGDEVGEKALDEIKQAFDHAKVWDPIICLPSHHFVEDTEGNYSVTVSSSNNKATTCNIDIIKLMRMSQQDIEIIQEQLHSQYDYPKKAIFRIQGVKGIEDKVKVKDIFLAAAKEKGSDLSVRSSDVEKKSPL